MPTDLRQTIASCATTVLLLRNQAELAYQRARRHFSAERMVDEYLEVYQALSAKKVDGRMTGKLRFRIFAHSWLSDWNHGNAHFLRGLARELVATGTRGPLL